jgi:hypothetical protein
VRDVRNDCLLSVDGTDFQIAMGYSKPFWRYKFKKSGLRYEVGLCIWQETFAGGVGLMPQGSGMTCPFSGTVYN